MGLSAAQQADLLFKQSMGVANSSPSKQFFEQPLGAAPTVLPGSIWTEADTIPLVPPAGMLNGEVSGVIRRWINLPLSYVAGSTQAFTASQLKNIIPFNFGDGTSYNYDIRGNGTKVVFGQNDWVLQNNVLTFYGGMSGIAFPLTISFYEYVGVLGISVIGQNLDFGQW
jgi:hypothetical protein